MGCNSDTDMSQEKIHWVLPKCVEQDATQLSVGGKFCTFSQCMGFIFSSRAWYAAMSSSQNKSHMTKLQTSCIGGSMSYWFSKSSMTLIGSTFIIISVVCFLWCSWSQCLAFCTMSKLLLPCHRSITSGITLSTMQLFHIPCLWIIPTVNCLERQNAYMPRMSICIMPCLSAWT